MFEDWPSKAAVADGTVELPKGALRVALDYAPATNEQSQIALEVTANTTDSWVALRERPGELMFTA